MRFSITAFFAAAVATIATAQTAQPNGPNPFVVPTTGLSFTAGSPSTISWTPTTSGTVTIILRQGSSSQLSDGTPIAKNIPNSGSISWTPPSDIVRGSDYAFEIVDDTNPNNINYTPQFVIDSSNTVSSVSASSTKATSSSAAATSSSSSASSTTDSSSSSESSSSTARPTTLATRTASATAAATTAAGTSAPSAAAAAPVIKVSGGLVVLALGMMAL